MLRTGLITIAMIAALQGICFGQGFLDSILGPSGLGLWGAASQQYKTPQTWEGAQGSSQQPYQNPATDGQQQITYPPAGTQAHLQGYPAKGDGYPQQGYNDQQQGVYGRPQNYTPSPIGGNPWQFSATQAFSAPQQYQASQQSQDPQQYAAPQAQAAARQGFLNSILGPGGLGLWGGGDAVSQQHKNFQMGGGVQGPSQQPYQQPAASGQQQITYPPNGAQAHPQSYPGKGDGYPQQLYSDQQQGVYGPQNYTPAPIGDKPQQYSTTHASSAPQQYQAPQQSQGPVQYVAPPAQAGSGPTGNATAEQPLYRPKPYVPGQAQVTAGDPNPAAVRMTTAPNGTAVQYYRPGDKPRGPQGSIKRPSQQLKPKRAGAKAQSKKRTQAREASNKWSTSHPW